MVKKSEGKAYRAKEWVFCGVCNTTFEKTFGNYHAVTISFHEEYCSWDPGITSLICNECYPAFRKKINELLPFSMG